MGGGRPAEDEETGGEEDGADHHWGEAGFRDGAVVVLNEAAGIEGVIAGAVSN